MLVNITHLLHHENFLMEKVDYYCPSEPKAKPAYFDIKQQEKTAVRLTAVKKAFFI